MTDDFIDSYPPIDEACCTTDPWPLPPVREWAPKPSLLQRLREWLFGVESV
jgi:hypothetical protein